MVLSKSSVGVTFVAAVHYLSEGPRLSTEAKNRRKLFLVKEEKSGGVWEGVNLQGRGIIFRGPSLAICAGGRSTL